MEKPVNQRRNGHSALRLGESGQLETFDPHPQADATPQPANPQGFFGDLAMRFRLFFNAGKVIEVLNDAEAIDESLDAHRLGAITIDGRDVSRDLLIGAHVTAGAAVEKLRHLVFGKRLAPLGEGNYLDARRFSANEPGPLILIDDERRN